MAKYLDLLLGASRFHKVEQRGANTFQITAANDSVECSAMFDNIVRTAVARAAREGITVREHKDSTHPGREFDFAVITVPESAGVSAKAGAPGQQDHPLPPADPSLWGATSDWDDAAQNAVAQHERAAAVPSSGDGGLIPPFEQVATVEHNPSAGEAHIRVDRTLKSPTRGSSASTSPFDAYAQPSTKASATFRENAERAEKLARALSATIKGEIDRLKGERRNDPERQAEIDFLEFVSTTLDQIAAAIGAARQAVAPQDQEQKFAEAESLASSLAKACRVFAERNYDRVIDYGGYSALTCLGTLLFTIALGVSPDEALMAQLVLLGLSSKKQ